MYAYTPILIIPARPTSVHTHPWMHTHTGARNPHVRAVRGSVGPGSLPLRTDHVCSGRTAGSPLKLLTFPHTEQPELETTRSRLRDCHKIAVVCINSAHLTPDLTSHSESRGPSVLWSHTTPLPCETFCLSTHLQPPLSYFGHAPHVPFVGLGTVP
jgi:hypothetical protein